MITLVRNFAEPIYDLLNEQSVLNFTTLIKQSGVNRQLPGKSHGLKMFVILYLISTLRLWN